MDSYQIDIILRRNIFTKKKFKGVYASNEIKKINEYPHCFVANTDRARYKGTHWLAFYVPNSETVEYFDSLAGPPNEDIMSYLKNFKNIKMNKNKVQANFEISCGPHTIYFLINRCKGLTFDRIIQTLRKPFSDILVKIFLYKLLSY